jgi:hypothetical protein
MTKRLDTPTPASDRPAFEISDEMLQAGRIAFFDVVGYQVPYNVSDGLTAAFLAMSSRMSEDSK